MSIDSIQPSGVSPTNPYHISRAYGVSAPAGVQQARTAAPIEPVQPVTREARGFAQSEGVRRLVAAVVPGGVDFTESGEARPAEGVLPMYRHPAEKNAAATGVTLGRSLDVSG